MTLKEMHNKLEALIGESKAKMKLRNFYKKALKAAAEPVDTVSLKGKIKEIIADLNLRTGMNFNHRTEVYQKLIKALMTKGYDYDDFIAVNKHKCAEWIGGDHETYLRPDTLYRPTNFPRYLDNIKASKPATRAEKKSKHGW